MRCLSILFGILLVFLVSGCGGDREKALIGRWGLSDTAAFFGGVRVADQTHSTQAGKQAAGMFANWALDINADKTFTFDLGPSILRGTWRFDPDVSKVTLTATSSTSNSVTTTADAKNPAVIINAMLDSDNTRLRIQSPTAEASNSGGISVPFQNEIPLKRTDQ